jgi:hypothetical protein
MNAEHVISEELWYHAQTAFSQNQFWIVYNTHSYFLEKGNTFFFNEEEKARQFAVDNKSKQSEYKVIHAQSLPEMLKQIPYGKLLETKLFNSKNLSIMNEKNFDYLSNQLKYTGFGEDLQSQLKEKMQKQEPQFTLNFQKDYGKDQTVATLHFRKSDESEMYFFNRYSLLLKNDQHTDPLKQTFYIGNKDDNVTLKEAYNLMSGRAVHKELSNKEGEKYKAWLQVDFKETDANGNYKMKQFHENYKYDLPATLANHPIKELSSETDKQRLIESLERGNRQSVTLTVHGREQKVFIEAVPQFKSLNFYESSGQRIRTDQLYQKNNNEESIKQDDQKQSLKQKNNDGDEAPDMNQKKTKRRKQSIS